ncbi:MAG: hypothetical protein JXX14_17790 [Deltaproteobacteria bacterium]|nr:hypothetical protein [Deltaproteobacteria bacterium]
MPANPTEKNVNEITSSDQLLSAAQKAEEEGRLADAVSLYNRILTANGSNKIALRSLALLRKDMGMTDEALRLFKAVAQIDPIAGAKDVVAILMESDKAQEAKLYIESLKIDDQQKEALLPLNDSHDHDEADSVVDATPDFTDTDAVIFADLFSGREGVHARQWRAPDGRCGYAPVHAPLTGALVRQHLLGEITAGVYVVRKDNQTMFMALDVDVSQDALQMDNSTEALLKARAFAVQLNHESQKRGLAPLMEFSGYKGYHLWFLFDEPWPAHKARRLAMSIVQGSGPAPATVHVDLFPAQSYVKKEGLGNLIKLPLGIHLFSGLRSKMVDENGDPLADGARCIREARRHSIELLEDLYVDLRISDKDGSGSINGYSGDSPDETETSPHEPEPVHCRSQISTYDDYTLDNDEELAWLMARCPVIAFLANKSLSGASLTHGEKTALTYTIGHLSCGPEAVNLLLCNHTGEQIPLKSRLRGNPASCKKIRQHLALAPGELNCMCTFDSTLGAYPHPLLHLAALRAMRDGEHLENPNALRENILRLESEMQRLKLYEKQLQSKAAQKERPASHDGFGDMQFMLPTTDGTVPEA